MTTLADEILTALPSLVQPYSKGLTIKEVAAHFCCSVADASAAFDELRSTWRAQVVRHGERGGTRRVTAIGHDFGLPGAFAKACRLCENLYQSQNEFYCSKKCSATDRWNRPGYKERVRAALSAAQSTPEAVARTRAVNKKRWSQPGEREKLSEHNRTVKWADPITRAKLSAGIQRVNGSPEMRKKISDRKKKEWQDPEYRERHVAAVRAHHQKPESREKFAELLRKRWEDPEMRAKYTRANRERNDKRKRGKPAL